MAIKVIVYYECCNSYTRRLQARWSYHSSMGMPATVAHKLAEKMAAERGVKISEVRWSMVK